jgi:superfamily I DNA and/or RNA helicase
MKMEGAKSFHTLMFAYGIMCHHNPEGHNLNNHHSENLKTCILPVYVLCSMCSEQILSCRLQTNRDNGGSRHPTIHFTHIFIDECGQALEPEALVPLVGNLGTAMKYRPGGQVIFAGDPMQLGPVCHSNVAEKFGLGELL